MQTFEVTGTVYHERTVEADNEAHAIALVRAELPGLLPKTVGDREFVDTCIISGEPIFTDDDFTADLEGGVTWLRCMADPTIEATAEDAR